jgi:hypothetical protein
VILLQLREKVRLRVGSPSGDQFITNDVLDDAINQAVMQIDAEYFWPWLEKTQTITTVSGTDTYSLPTDFRASRSLVIQASDGGKTIMYNVAPAQALAKVSTDIGLPQGYAISGSSLILLPTPGASYAITHLYYRMSPMLTAEQDSPLIPDQWHPAIIAAAASVVASREELRGQKDAADADVAQWIRRMRNALRRSTGPVVPRVRSNGWL